MATPALDARLTVSASAVFKGDPGAAMSDPAKAEEKDGAAAKAKSADPVVPRTKSAQTISGAARQPYSSTARMMSGKKLPAGVRLAKAKPQADLKRPPPEQAVASKPVQSLAPAPQLTDAGNDGMFN